MAAVPTAPPKSGACITGEDPVSPTTADVYAAACLTYETLTTQPLFNQSSEMELVTAHYVARRMADAAATWYQQKAVADLARLVGLALRRDPRERIEMSEYASSSPRSRPSSRRSLGRSALSSRRAHPDEASIANTRHAARASSEIVQPRRSA